MPLLFTSWIIRDDCAFKKTIGGVAIVGNFTCMAGVAFVRNGPINSCNSQSSASCRRNFKWWVDLLDHKGRDERTSKHY